jgi:ATP-binding cassette, subfamily B, bacterial PglK
MILNGLIEAAGVGGILPLMTAATDPESPKTNRLVGWLYNHIPADSYQQFLLLLSLGTVLLFALVNVFGALTFWMSSRFANDARHAIACRILRCYLSHPYSWYLGQNSSELTKDVLSEVDAVTHEVIMKLATMTNYLISSSLIFVGLLYVDFVMAISTVFILTMVYRAIFSFFKKKLQVIGDERLEANTQRYRTVTEALSVVKEVRAFSRRSYFSQRFEAPSKSFSDTQVTHQLMASLPRYITETIAVGAILGVMMYLIAQGNRTVLPLVTLYIMATWRLVPAVQNIYKNAIQVQFHLPALGAVDRAISLPQQEGWEMNDDCSALEFEDSVVIEAGEFRYPVAKVSALSDIHLRIPKNSSVALVGRTGEGKSTLADVLAGHLELRSGSLKIDGQALDPDSLARWRENVGIVPQEIFLLDDTVKRNIALGLTDDEIDAERMEKAAETAQIKEFVDQELPNGYNTTMGERGISLSGGQRQRIGIARALYNNPQVLIFDEATSSLDKVTEKAVMDAIETLHGEKTLILIAHRLSTIKLCDQICLIEAGKIRALGTYQELLNTDSLFQELVKLEFSSSSDSAS